MKIALIAMSGVRIRNEELVNLGLTLPAFVERGKVIASLPSLGLLTLAALTPPEHEVFYFEVEDILELPALPTDFDMVAISSFSAQIDEAYELAAWFKSLGTPSVLGGLHVTMCPEEAAQFCSTIVLGEGEIVWHQLIDDLEKGCLEPVYDARDRSFDLAQAPIPSFHLLDINRYNRLTVQTSRGCPHRCEFCASSILLTPYYKQKPVQKVITEIDRILEIWKRPFLEFADDNSMVNKKYWKELTSELESRRIRWFTETDISVSNDTELLELMGRSGCAQVLIGLESPVESGLSGIELNRDWKHKKYPKYKDAIKTIQSHGITVNGCFVLGLDGHTKEIFDQVFEFVHDTCLFEVQVTIQTAFPGTPLYDRLLKSNRIIEPGNWKMCTLFDVNYLPTHMSVEELTTGFRNLIKRLYDPGFTKWRREKFRDLLREQKPKRESIV